MAAADEMQADAQFSQKVRALREVIGLGAGDESCLSHFFPGCAVTGGFGVPQKHLQVAQTAQTFLDVGFEGIGSVAVFLVTLPHFEHFAAKKHAAVELLQKSVVGVLKKSFVSVDPSRLQKGGCRRDVGGGDFERFGFGSDIGADRQSQAPEQGDELRNGGLIGLREAFGGEHRHVDIRVREHFSAAVAAERGDRAGGGNFGKRGAIFDELVDDGSMVPQIKADLGVRRKVLGKLFSEVDVRFDGKVAFGRHDAGSQNS
jgi:hypothetical protein